MSEDTSDNTDNTPPIRVLLADDHAVIREALRLLMGRQAHLHLVGEATTCREVVEVAAREQPDIIVLDLQLSDGSSLEWIPQLGRLAPGAKIIIFSGADDPEMPRRAVQAGALGWVGKGQSSEVLLRAIECVHAGEVWLERTLLARVLGQLTHHSGAGGAPVISPADAARIATLTPRERDIICLIAQGLKNKQIAARLFLSEKTVHSHLASIFQKLEVSDRLELAIFAHHNGLLDTARLSHL